MSEKIAVVTGGAGFIGSHAVDLLLKKKFIVRVIDDFSGGHEKNLIQHKGNPQLEIHRKDIRLLSPKDSIFMGTNYVFHFAGLGDIVPSVEKPIDYLDVNVQGTAKVLECSRNAGVKKFVYAASSSCYGIATTPTTEEHEIQPQYPYALSKFQAEQLVLHWAKVYGLPAISLRIFNAYGPRVRTTGAYGAVFGVFLKQKLSGNPMTVVGDGSQKRDFVFVTDVAEAFYKAAISKFTQKVYNIGGGSPKTINQLVNLIGGDVSYIPFRPGEPSVTWADTTKIQNDLKWHPKISFEVGVSKMLEKIMDWKDAPLWDPNSIETATKPWFKYLATAN